MPIVIAFVSQKGGVGKSTLARALGAVAAHSGTSAVIADLDPQQGTILRWEKSREKHHIEPLLTVRPFSTVAEVFERPIKQDLLIIDGPVRASKGTLELARHSHLVVLPAGASVDDLHPTVLLLHELVHAGIPKVRLVVALCRVLTETEEEAARAYVQKAGYDVLPGSIPEKAAYREALNRGQALTETKHKALNERADALMAALLRKVRLLLQAIEADKKKRAKERA